MASILFFAPDDLGETVLATGALSHALAGDDVVTISAPVEAAPLFRAIPGVRIWLPPHAALGFACFARLRGLRFDVVLDGRGRLAGRIAAGRRVIRRKPSAVLRHLCEDWAEAARAEWVLEPKLWVDEEARASAEIGLHAGAPLLVLAPGGVNERKLWPAERFAAVARRLAGSALPEVEIVVLGAAARDAAITARIVRSLDADGVPARDLGERLDLLAAAALFERATLCIGNDNALTHIAAAAGAPTLTLFGPTDERVRAPRGPRARALRARPIEAAVGLDAATAMGDISIDMVEAAALELLHAGGLG